MMLNYERQLTDQQFQEIYGDEYYRQFDEAAHGYPVSRFINPPRKWQLREQVMLDLVELAGDQVVIEAGSAAGSLSLVLARHARRVIGVDMSPVAVELARQRAGQHGMPNVEFVVASIADLSFAQPASIDRIVAFDIVEHVYNDVLRSFFLESARVLKPGGYLCLYTPNLNHYVERLKQQGLLIAQVPGHIAVRNWRMIDQQRAASGARLDLDRLYYIGSPYPIVRQLDRLLMRLPGIGDLFRWRICARLVKRGA